jgi:hypothetical protein
MYDPVDLFPAPPTLIRRLVALVAVVDTSPTGAEDTPIRCRAWFL